MSTESTLTSKGQTTVPKAIRESSGFVQSGPGQLTYLR